MIKFLINKDGKIGIDSSMKAPAVYLDHWALRNISEVKSLRSKFQTALKARNGTLTLSWLNLIEFSKVADATQARLAETFVEDLLPNVFFLEVNPFTVIKEEDRLLAGGKLVPPHADSALLKVFAELKTHSVKPFTAHNLFCAVQGKNTVVVEFAALADTIIEHVKILREDMDGDSDLGNRVRRLPSGPKIQRGTRYVLRELARTLLIDRGINLRRNHAIDLVHAVVPAAYCDMVLLDKHWEHQVNSVRARFAEANMAVPLAQVYSRRQDGMERLLAALRSSNA